MRTADEAGWLDSEHIAVVLDYTQTEGGWKFAADVSELVTEKIDRPEYRVYTYSSLPKKKDNNKDDNDDDIFNRRQPPGRLHEEPREKYNIHASSAVVSREQQADTTVKSCSSLVKHEFKKPAGQIEPFLAQRMPYYKRFMDIVGSLMGLLVLSPFFLIVAILIKIVSRGPVFFKQERIGYLGKKYKIWKFRTMRVDADQTTHRKYLAELIKSGAEGTADNDKSMKKLENDARVIPLGDLLRKTAIDELPQLFNVLKGEMSLIGPRPPIPYEVEEYQRWHFGRFDAVPGMTGLWQVSGKNRTTFKEMVRFDINYARRMSWRLDARILAGTIPAIVTQIKDTL